MTAEREVDANEEEQRKGGPHEGGRAGRKERKEKLTRQMGAMRREEVVEGLRKLIDRIL